MKLLKLFINDELIAFHAVANDKLNEFVKYCEMVCERASTWRIHATPIYGPVQFIETAHTLLIQNKPVTFKYKHIHPFYFEGLSAKAIKQEVNSLNEKIRIGKYVEKFDYPLPLKDKISVVEVMVCDKPVWYGVMKPELAKLFKQNIHEWFAGDTKKFCAPNGQMIPRPIHQAVSREYESGRASIYINQKWLSAWDNVTVEQLEERISEMNKVLEYKPDPVITMTKKQVLNTMNKFATSGMLGAGEKAVFDYLLKLFEK